MPRILPLPAEDGKRFVGPGNAVRVLIISPEDKSPATRDPTKDQA